MISLERLEGCWTVFRWSFWSAVLGIALLALFPISCHRGGEHTKAQAMNDLLQTITAIKGFRTEYGNYPLQELPTDKDLVVNFQNQRDLYNMLRALEQKVETPPIKTQNKRGIIFFEGKNAKEVPPKSGFAEDGTLYDPWGGVYQFVLDTNEDGKVTVPTDWNQPDSKEEIKAGIIGYSPGKTARPKDDVTTW